MAQLKRSGEDAARLAASKEIERCCRAVDELRLALDSILRRGGGEPTVALLVAAADDCPDAVAVCTDAADIRIVNGAAARLLGQSTRSLQALTLWDITHPSSQGDFEVLWKEFLRAGRQRGQFTMRHHDGSSVEVAYCALAGVLPHLHVTVFRKLGEPAPRP